MPSMIIYSPAPISANDPNNVWMQLYSTAGERDSILARARAIRTAQGGTIFDVPSFSYTTVKPMATNVWNGRNLNDCRQMESALRLANDAASVALADEIAAAVSTFLANEA